MFAKISPANWYQMLSLKNFKKEHVSNVMSQNFSNGAVLSFDCVPLIGPLVHSMLLWRITVFQRDKRTAAAEC